MSRYPRRCYETALTRRGSRKGGNGWDKAKIIMEDIKVEAVELWFANFRATRGLNQSFGETPEEAIRNLIANEN